MQGTVISDGQPVVGAVVELKFQQKVVTTQTDAAGHFRIGPLGEYLIGVIGTDAAWPYYPYLLTIQKDGTTYLGLEASPDAYISYVTRLKCDLSASPMRVGKTGFYCGDDKPAVAESLMQSSQLLLHPSNYDYTKVEVSGYLRRDGNIARFYVSSDAASRTDFKYLIDVYSDDRSIDSGMLKYEEPTCVIIKGTFRAYDPRRLFIGIGNFVSQTGLIDVTSVLPCDDSTPRADKTED